MNHEGPHIPFEGSASAGQNPALPPSGLQAQAEHFARQQARRAIADGFAFVALHRYDDAHGNPLYWKTRYKHPDRRKWIRALHRTDSGVFRLKEPDFSRVYPDGSGKKPVYRLPDVINSPHTAPVFITEGEQKADALAALGLIATTSGGASSTDTTHWQALAGRTITLWPDHDTAGQKYAQAVAALLQGMGCTVALLDVNALNLPAKGDVIDWLAQRQAAGLATTAADVLALATVTPDPATTSANSTEDSAASNDDSPHDDHNGQYFYLDEDNPAPERRGVYHVGVNHEGRQLPPFQVCGVLKITALTRNADHQDHGYLLEWYDRDNHRHRWAMPAELFKGDGADYRGELLRCGLYIAPGLKARNRLAEYIQSQHVAARAVCVDRTGWHGDWYVTPQRTYGPVKPDETVIYQSTNPPAGYRERGTLADWRTLVAEPCAGNSRLVFALCTAFAGPLLRLAGEESGGFHLRGDGSTGKSTCQHVACSVWGGRDYKHQWRATANGLEVVAVLHNDGLLILDEMGQADPREIGDTVYMLGNGQGKIRSHKTITARKMSAWRLMLLSSGELSLEQMMLDGGKKTRAGHEVRLVDIPADAGRGMGVIERLHRHTTAKSLIDSLNSHTDQQHGTAGRAFLEAITTQDKHSLSDAVRHAVAAFTGHHAGACSATHPQVQRVASRCGLVAVAGEIATEHGLTGWQPGEARRAAGAVFAAWLAGRGGSGNQEATAIKAQVRAFFEAHGDSRFADWDDAQGVQARNIHNRAGFRQKRHDADLYAVLPEAYKVDVCAGYDPRNVSKILIAAGWLEPDKNGKATQNVRLPGMGQTRAYVFTGKLWADDTA